MTPDDFRSLMTPVMSFLSGRAVDRKLGDDINSAFPGDGPAVKAIEAGCLAAIAEGWMCNRGDPGLRFGRVVKPSPESFDFSVDVVDLTEIAGPQHSHPAGEICLVMPVDEAAKFDGKGRGWCIYDPGSAHRPTVKGGRALILYLLPGGKIEFKA